MSELRCIIMGAAGRDFHDFQTFFLRHPEFRVVCFTATQIPFIDTRRFPKELAGPGYEEDIPIVSEERLSTLIREHAIDFVFLSHSDLSFVDVMHKASLVQAAGASFALLGPKHTELESIRPVISVTAVRTGCGKSPISRAIAAYLGQQGRNVGIIRHPMPYGELRKQAVQRFASFEDLDRHQCTVEEREEYEPYIERGMTIFAGVDYAEILKEAEQGSDVILWDGGNNDSAFIKAGLQIVVLDALRPGHEVEYYPGETNLRRADVLVINKVGHASPESIGQIRQNIREYNRHAEVIEADLEISVDDPTLITGRRALVIEDGPTLTHGGMSFGAGVIAARAHGARSLIDPRPGAVGSIKETLERYPRLKEVLPALGYSEAQRRDLAETVRRLQPEVVVDGSPARLNQLLGPDIPVARVHYRFSQRSGPDLMARVDRFLSSWRAQLERIS